MTHLERQGFELWAEGPSGRYFEKKEGGSGGFEPLSCRIDGGCHEFGDLSPHIPLNGEPDQPKTGFCYDGL